MVIRGLGSIGRRHAEVFGLLGAEVVVWPVRPRLDRESTARLVDDTTAPRAVDSADLVVVATDTSRHVRDAVEALDAGAARVLVEKPAAPTARDASELARHPRAADVGVAAPLRAHEAFRYLATALTTTVVTSAHLWCQSWLPDWRPDRDYRQSYSARRDEGGVLRDLVHELDYATVLLGNATLRGACIEQEGPLNMSAEQAATLLWRTPTATVTCRLDYVTRPPTRGVILRGPAGAVGWDVLTATVHRTDADGVTTSRSFAHDLERANVMAVQARAALEMPSNAGHADRVAAGAPASLTEAVRILQLCDQARGLRHRPAEPIT